jgi:hypothetical protein
MGHPESTPSHPERPAASCDEWEPGSYGDARILLPLQVPAKVTVTRSD